MSAPNIQKQKNARTILRTLFSSAANVWVIHYSCESFYDRPDGASPRITSIAVRKLDSAQTNSFSIHQVAEKRRVSFEEIDNHYDDLEKQMLQEFFDFIGSYKGSKFIHWNMRDINYGFAALEHRITVLGGTPTIIADDNKFDLSRLLIDIYGVHYIGHPRLESLLTKNNIRPRDFLSGSAEAAAFEQRNFAALHQSTLRKVDVLANIAERAFNQQLKTNTTWWEMNGGQLRSAVAVLSENKLLTLLAGIASIIGLAIAIYTLR